VNAASERVLVGALEKHFDQLVVFENRHFDLVAIRRNHQFFAHACSYSSWREPELEESVRENTVSPIPRVIPQDRLPGAPDLKIFQPPEMEITLKHLGKALNPTAGLD
jgi:hypothetical protein